MTFSPILRLSLIIAAVFCVSVSSAQQTQYSHGEPTALEQYMLELINRARMKPTQEGIILDTVNTAYSAFARQNFPSFFTNLRAEFASYPAVAPLAFNSMLIKAARAHSQDMITRNFFSHVNPEGKDPTARAAAQGYTGGVGENIDGGGAQNQGEIEESHFGFMVDYNNIDTAHPLGHRYNVLDSDFVEIGVGVAGPRYGGKITQDFGSPARSYILGVAYSDDNNDGGYDVGEGLLGVTVKPDIGNWFAITSTSGGFAIPIDPVETVTDTVNVPYPVQTTPWSTIQPYDTAYRNQQIAAAPTMTVNLTWSSAYFDAPKTTSVTIKRPVKRNYRIVGTDNWYYSFSMVTSQNAKADLNAIVSSTNGNANKVKRDFNSDGNADLLLQNNTGKITAWNMNGGGGITSSTALFSGSLNDWRVMAVADFNNDGKADLVFQNAAGQIAVWYLDGKGAVLGSTLLHSAGLGDWRIAAATDLNNDGNADLVFQNNAGQIVVWYLNGRGVIATSTMLYSGSLNTWRIVAAADMNGDGNSDILFQNSSGQIVAWYMDGKGTLTSSAFLSSANINDWRVKVAADMNGDGNVDLVFQNNVGKVAVWYMNGKGAVSSSALIYSSSLGDWRLR